MTDVPDARLLEQFARNASEEAFAALVQRHIGLVHSVALRHTANAQHAEDITQAVFVILARKAGAFGRKTVLPGWLYHTARLTAANLQRAETRRVRREQEAFMQSTLEKSPTDTLWRELAPQLDEAMAGLGATERDAVVLQYFQNKSMAEVGEYLGLEENTAQKRVGRALEKLRRFFAKRGVDSTATGIADTISTHSVQPVPAALAKSVTAVAVAKGASASISTLTLIKGALKIMAWTKAKTAIVACVGVLLTAGTATVVVEKVAHANSLIQRLPDGSVLALNQVSFGNRLTVQFGITGKNAANNPLVKPSFYRQFRCVIRGDAGIEYVEEFSPAPGIKKLSGGNVNTVPQTSFSVQTSIFPRDSKWLWFRVEKSETNNPYGPWQTVAEFKVPNPTRTANNPWVASPIPITNSVDGMEFVLAEVTVETRPFSQRDIWNHVVTVPTKVFDHGILLTNWGASYDQMADASGNWNPILQRHRSLDPRYVWKLDMDFEPQSDFTPENMATVNLPRAGSKISTGVMGQPVTISWDGTWIDADMPTNRPDLALKFVGAADTQGNEMLNPSGGGSQYRFREGDFMVPARRRDEHGGRPANKANLCRRSQHPYHILCSTAARDRKSEIIYLLLSSEFVYWWKDEPQHGAGGAMKVDGQTLSLFADGMATCLAAGLPPQRALELNQFEKQSKALGKLVRVARQRCEQGIPLSEALEPGRNVLPHYFLPVIRAGEAGGRLVEAFQLLGRHSRRIAPSARLVRNTWLYPLILVVFGWVIRIGIFLFFGKSAAAWHFFLGSFGIGSMLVLAGWLLLKRREVKDAVDSLLLQIPVLREAELGLGKVLFFSTFRLTYEAGGLHVVTMFDLAFESIRNSAIRRDWLKAREVLEEHGTFADAFGRLTLLEDRFKGMIATGSISGKLDQSLTQLVALVTEQLEFTLQTFNNIFQRIVAFCVAMSIVETIAVCTQF